MKIKVNDVHMCKIGGSHVCFDLLINDSVTRTFSSTLADIDSLVENTPDQIIGLLRMHCHCVENNATTLLQMKNALLDQEFEW